jgi:hypothetical protein
MRTSTWLAPLLSVLLAVPGLVAAQSRPATPAPAATPAALAAKPRPVASTRYVITGTIKELMHGVIDPSADALWDAVSYDITAAGVVETMPRTNEDWYAVRRHALILAESANLLRVPGRRVAPATPIPSLVDEPPAPEDLPPEQIQILIDRDRAKFARLSQGLIDAAVLAIKAADAKDVNRLSEAGDLLDRACESCHSEYWYPKGGAPAAAPSMRRKP